MPIKIKAPIVNKLFELMLEEAGAERNHRGMAVLSQKINERFYQQIDWEFTQKYFYYRILRPLERCGPTDEIGLDVEYADKMAEFVHYKGGIKAFIKEWEKLIDPSPELNDPNRLKNVWYSSKSYYLLNIWRSPDIGILTKESSKICYKSAQRLLINLTINATQVQKICLHDMPGDGGKFWVKLIFKQDGQLHQAYFASRNPKGKLNLGDPQSLLNFINSTLKN